MFGVLTTGAEIAKNSADLGQLEKQTLFLCESKVFVIISGTIFPWKFQLGVQSVFPQLVAIQEVFFWLIWVNLLFARILIIRSQLNHVLRNPDADISM